MSLRRAGLLAAAAVVAVGASGIVAAPSAEARAFVRFGFGVPAVYPVPVYAPPPVYYPPPPMYYRVGVAYPPAVIYHRRVVHHVHHVAHRSCNCACP